MLDEAFLQLVRCPISRTPLRAAPEELVRRVNHAIEQGEVVNRLGEKVDLPIDSGLINADSTLLYPVRHEIPTLIAEEAVELPGLRGNAEAD